jgi:excisionase family DNA binding protein
VERPRIRTIPAADKPGECFLTPQDVATLLQIPVGTLYSWRHNGLGPPAKRMGKHLRYHRDAILKWAQDGEN